MAMALARLGYRALIIEGNAQENQLFNLVIDADGEARLEEAQAYKGTRNYALAGAVRSFPNTGQPFILSGTNASGSLPTRNASQGQFYGAEIEFNQAAGLSAEDDRLPAMFYKDDLQALHAARNFVASGMQSIFLQDGNSLIIKPEEMVRILEHIKQAFPRVERITSSARSHTIARISDENLAKIARAGLNRIHIGMESGSDAVLKKIRKGTDKKTQVLAGQKVKRAGMELSEYYMPGLGGKSLSEDNAVETADALNQINPDFIRIRTLALPDGTPLTDQSGHDPL